MSASTAQLELGELRPAIPSPLSLRFAIFNEAYPAVYRALEALAREKVERQKRKGRVPRISGNALIFAARWDEDDERLDALPFINNSFASRYARLIAERNPDLAPFFETRELNS